MFNDGSGRRSKIDSYGCLLLGSHFGQKIVTYDVAVDFESCVSRVIVQSHVNIDSVA
jgi:hypothetical protein